MSDLYLFNVPTTYEMVVSVYSFGAVADVISSVLTPSKRGTQQANLHSTWQ